MRVILLHFFINSTDSININVAVSSLVSCMRVRDKVRGNECCTTTASSHLRRIGNQMRFNLKAATFVNISNSEDSVRLINKGTSFNSFLMSFFPCTVVI